MPRNGNDRMLSRLSRALRACLCCVCFASVGCAHGGVAPGVCHEPNPLEELSWDKVVESGEYKPAVRWVGRLIAKCWPELAEEVREDE